MKEQFGTAAPTPIYNKLFYNSRGQLAEIRASTSYTGPADFTADRGAIVNKYSNNCTTGICSGESMPDNNGNLRKQEIHIPNQTMRYQEYDYDSLNRLNSVREVLDGGPEQWKQAFTYDRWGNRKINTGITYGTGINNKAFNVDETNNRLEVPTGQSGVMQYDVAGNLINDTYTGAGNRTYDGENKITSAWGGNNQAQIYGYDASGQRIKRTVDGVETWQVYGFGGELLAEYPANAVPASPQKEFGHRNDQLLLTAEAGGAQGGGGTQNVNWTNAVGVSISGNNLTRTAAGDGWNAGAISTQMIASGDGYAEFTATETNKQRTMGLTNNTSVINIGHIAFGMHLNESGQITIHEGYGVYGVFGTYTSGDKLRVSIEAGVVKYRKNGTLLRTSTLAPTYPLYAGAAIYNSGGTVSNAVITSNQQNVNWTNAVGVSISGNNLTKTAGDDWHNARASSTQAINSASGYVEFTASETTTNRMLGLGEFGTGSYTYSNIRYAIYLAGSVLYTNEYGSLTNVGSYTSGDKLRVAIENGAVRYYKNGTLLRTSVLAPIYPLYVNVALYSNGSTLTGAMFDDGSSSGGSSAQIQWLVTDHLGTPRMIFDQTGSLANMKRHDYLPFGEELFAPTGGRSAAQGYAGGDGVRQQFTLYERDVETGLDYAQARYYSSMQGRFTSPDPLLASGQAKLPQSWNRYTYCINNPLAYVDPTGMIWYTKNGGDGSPMWFDNDPGEGYTQFTQYSYYAGEKYGYVALDPYSRNYQIGFDTEEEASAYSNQLAGETMQARDPGQYVSQLDGTMEVATYISGAQALARIGIAAGESLLARKAAQETLTGVATQATMHGVERLAARGFSAADIALTKTGAQFLQRDGATVSLKEVTPGKFNVIVEGSRGVVTALKNISEKSVARLSQNYGWFSSIK